MKLIKRIIFLLLTIAVLAFLSRIIFKEYISNKDPVQKDLEVIETIVDMFEDKLTELGIDEEMVDDVITKIEEYNNETKYVIAFNIENENYSVINTKIHLPVDKDFFDSVEIGDRIAEEEIKNFEQFSQFLGDWVITVEDKIVRE